MSSRSRAARTQCRHGSRADLVRLLDQPRLALDALAKAVGGGYFCYGPLTQDAWFDSIRSEPEFERLLNQARDGHESAVAAFREAGGPAALATPF